jgi:hypothetical protein
MIHERWWKYTISPRTPLDDGIGFGIRFATDGDAGALYRLAVTDSQEPLTGPVLLAEVGTEIWAAVTVEREPRAIADPFRPSAGLVEILKERRSTLQAQPVQAHRPMRAIVPQTR